MRKSDVFIPGAGATTRVPVDTPFKVLGAVDIGAQLLGGDAGVEDMDGGCVAVVEGGDSLAW